MIHTTDVTIIGAGPVGLFAIFECGMMKLKTHVIDALPEVGGQCVALYPEKPIYDIPAHPKILAGELIDNLKAQAAPFSPVYHLNQQVVSLQPVENQWEITTSTGKIVRSKIVIIAAGVGAFGPNRPPLENIESFENKSVFYHVRNMENFRGKKVVIAGGGDSAIDWALNLAPIAERVTVVHRRPKFKAAPDSVGQLHELASQGALDLAIPFQLADLDGENGVLRQVIVSDLEGERKAIDADYLLAFFGLSMNLGPIATWGLTLDKSHIVVDPATCQTSEAGIFAIGDIASYPHKQKLILTGFAEAAQAAHQARSIVYPGEVFHFEYSTSKGLPGSSV
ncbi:MAG: NAD(P)/FAD-dependent oxidoreductase [Alphaproteobacteria bacterium]